MLPGMHGCHFLSMPLVSFPLPMKTALATSLCSTVWKSREIGWCVIPSVSFCHSECLIPSSWMKWRILLVQVIKLGCGVIPNAVRNLIETEYETSLRSNLTKTHFFSVRSSTSHHTLELSDPSHLLGMTPLFCHPEGSEGHSWHSAEPPLRSKREWYNKHSA